LLKFQHQINFMVDIVFDPLPYSSLVPAGNQHYHHNEENMSKACLQNYEVLVNTILRQHHMLYHISL
jgi:hypothetical protein